MNKNLEKDRGQQLFPAFVSQPEPIQLFNCKK